MIRCCKCIFRAREAAVNGALLRNGTARVMKRLPGLSGLWPDSSLLEVPVSDRSTLEDL